MRWVQKGAKSAFLATSIAFLAVFPGLQAKINVPIVFSTQKSLKIQIFSLVQKVDLILLHSVMHSYIVKITINMCLKSSQNFLACQYRNCSFVRILHYMSRFLKLFIGYYHPTILYMLAAFCDFSYLGGVFCLNHRNEPRFKFSHTSSVFGNLVIRSLGNSN